MRDEHRAGRARGGDAGVPARRHSAHRGAALAFGRGLDDPDGERREHQRDGRAGEGSDRSRPPPRRSYLTLIVASIQGWTAQMKFSVVPFFAVTLKLTLPLGGR